MTALFLGEILIEYLAYCKYFHKFNLYESIEIGDLWDFIAIKFGSYYVSIGSKVSVDDPLPSLHVREPSIFGKPVNSVARLPKDEGVLFFHNSLSVFFSRQKGLPLEEL